MAYYLTHDLIIHLIFFQAVMLGIILSNIFVLHHARKRKALHDYPFVSILIPARNEEKNISQCIFSLLAQDYPDFEVLALDDQSSDSTLVILEQIASINHRLKVLKGSSPPPQLSGKSWACSQLACQAQGDLLLFTDADTVHKPEALRQIVSAMMQEQVDFLTGFPQQQLNTWGERLLVPFFSWALLCFVPLWLAYRLRLPALTSAVGQLMMFRREAYDAIGGHKNLIDVIVDDLTLARRIKAAGRRWRVIRVADLISCRMYHSSRETIEGFTKNLFATFEFRLIPFGFAFLWLVVLFWEPLIVLAALALGYGSAARVDHLTICIGLSILVWLLPFTEMRLPLGLALLYPLIIIANELVAFRSLRVSLRGKLMWKGRTLVKPKWRWL